MGEIFNLVKHLIWHRKISFHCEINTSKQCNFNARCQLAYPKQFYSSYQKQKKKSALVFLKTQKLLVPVPIPERENRGKNITGLCPSIWEKCVPVHECRGLGHCTTPERRRLRAHHCPLDIMINAMNKQKTHSSKKGGMSLSQRGQLAFSTLLCLQQSIV